MTKLYKSDKCFDSCCTNPFPKVENPVVQGDKVTNELVPLVDVQDIQKVLKVIENDRNGRQHPLQIWLCKSGEGVGKRRDTSSKIFPDTLAGVDVYDLAILY